MNKDNQDSKKLIKLLRTLKIFEAMERAQDLIIRSQPKNKDE